MKASDRSESGGVARIWNRDQFDRHVGILRTNSKWITYYPYANNGSKLVNRMSITLTTPQDVQRALAKRFKARRLARNFSQEGLGKRAGVSWGSLKRFEQKGLIAIDSILRLALVLDCLDHFDAVGVEDRKNLESMSLDEVLAAPKERRKGRIK